MDNSASSLRAQAQGLQTRIKSLLNQQLKELCRQEGLLVSGVKAALQNRLFERLDDLVESSDFVMFNTFQNRVNALAAPQQKSSSPYTNHGSSSTTANSHSRHSAFPPMSNGYRSAGASSSNHVSSSGRLTFKESPFYTILEHLTTYVDLPVMTSNRNTATAAFSLSSSNMERLRTDASLRIMLYCMVDPGHTAYPQDIAFPNQVDLRVNENQFSGNLRGIKKKPGTTRPADITDITTRRSKDSMNVVSVTYAATDRVHNPSPSKFCMIVYLVRKHSVEELVDRIKRSSKIAAQTVINEMLKRADDPDIETTSTKMSLRCPLSTMRMSLPIRSINCNHNRCFDAASFLQSQEQAPQWSCPTCNNSCKFDTLAVDGYVQEILAKVPESVDEITIEPDGQWRVGGEKEETKVASATKSFRRNLSSEADDFWEVSDTTNGNGLRFLTPQSTARTPQLDSKAPSRAVSSAPKTNNKRPADDVIDLTADSDEDEPPRRPIKRQSTSSFLGSSLNVPPQQLPLPKPQPSAPHSYSFALPSNGSNSVNGYGGSHGYGSWN